MDRKRLFKTSAYLIVLLFLFNYIAVKLYWYNSIWYFDMFMHFLGGFWLGLIFLWLLSFKNSSVQISWKLVYKVFLGVLLFGVLWEVFEIIFNNYIAGNPFIVLDTISDIFFDLTGGTFAVFYFFVFKRTMLTEENRVK